MIDNTSIQIRDQAACTCGHKLVSHGSYNQGHEFMGIGRGMCGIDRDTRNFASGYMGDMCPCVLFAEAK